MITLSEQQTNICRLAAQGYSIKQIAVALDVSNNTITTQRRRIMEKMNANNFTQVEANLSLKMMTKNNAKIDLPDITVWYHNSNGKVFTRQIFRE